MLRPMPASEPDSPQDRHYSGPYGLVDGSDEAVGEADDSEERAATTAGGGTPGERSTQVLYFWTSTPELSLHCFSCQR